MVCQKLDGGASPSDVANDVVNSSGMPAYHCGYFVGAAIKVYCRSTCLRRKIPGRLTA